MQGEESRRHRVRTGREDGQRSRTEVMVYRKIPER